MSDQIFRHGFGRLATDRFDFEKHVNGSDFRHQASNVDLNTPITIGSTTSTDINSSLTNIASFINNLSITGQGFITVGDGYDTYHNANGTINFDISVPSLDTLLNPLFTSIINYQADIAASASTIRPVLSGYERIKDGGIIVIKAGTYIIKNTVSVPPGFILLGEGFGTKIINATALNTGVVPVIPKTIPTPAPIFRIKRDSNRTLTDRAVDQTLFSTFPFMFARETKFINLTIADNFVEPTQLGDTFYILPQNNSTTNPLIIVEEGSYFTLESVKVLGRVNYGGVSVNNITSHVIKTDGTTPITNGTIINIKNSFIDGFAVPVIFGSKGGTNDYFIATGNSIKFYGFLNADFTALPNNCCFNLTVCNTEIQNNYIYGHINSTVAALYLSDVAAGTVNIQAKSKIIFSNNDVALNKAFNSAMTPSLVQASATVLSNTNKFILINQSNLFNKYEVYVDRFANLPQISVDNINTNIGATNLLTLSSDQNIVISSDSVDGYVNVVYGEDGYTKIINGVVNATFGSNSVEINAEDISLTSTNDVNLTATNNIKLDSLAGILVSGTISGDSSSSDTLRFGRSSVAIAAGTVTLTASEYNHQVIELTGTTALTSVQNVSVHLPAVAGYAKLISNKSSGNFRVTVKTPSGNGVHIPQNSSKWVFCDGIDIKSGTAEEREIPTDLNTIFLYRCNEKYEFPFLGLENNGSGTSVDLLPQSSSTFGVAGLFDRALRFRGTTSEYYTGDTNVNTFSTTAVSISCWFKPGDLDGNLHRLWGKVRTDVANSVFDLIISGASNSIGGNLKRVGVGTVDTVTADVDCNISAGVWNHIALTYDGSFLALYVNGLLADVQNYNGLVDWGQPSQWVAGSFIFDDSFSPIGQLCDLRADGAVRNEEYYAEMYRRGICANSY